MEPADGHPTIQHCIRSFEPYLAANRRTEKPVIHISLNPHPDDVLTDEQLTAIGQEYMEKMGYGNQPYIIYRHEDIGRPHIHIVSLRIDEQGKKIKDYKEWQRSTAVCRELERKYHLLPAEKMERRESLPLTAVDYRKGDIKHLALAVYGFRLGLRGLNERDKKYITCKVGIGVNGLVLAGVAAIFIRGLV